MASTSFWSMTAPEPEHLAFAFNWMHRSSMSTSPDWTFCDLCIRSLWLGVSNKVEPLWKQERTIAYCRLGIA